MAVYRLARWLCSDRTKLIVFAASGMARLRESTLRLLAGFMVAEYALVWLFCAHLPWHCPLSMPYRHSMVYATVVLVLGGALAAVKVLTRRLPLLNPG